MKLALSLLALPLLAQETAGLYSVEKERAIGLQYASEIRRQSQPLRNERVDAYVQRLGRRIVAELKESPFEYTFEVISDSAHSEPFALPGAYVFVPARSFTAAQDEAEFAGMLAHAIGHAALRHGTRPARSGSVNMASIPLVFMHGWTGAHAELRQSTDVLVPVSLLPAHREQELEADRFGLELAARAGFDPAAFERYVQRTQGEDRKFSPLPARDLRLARMRETVASLARPTPSAAGDFATAQAVVRTILQQPPSPRRAPSLRR